MKQFILFLLVLLPFCVYSQVNETFSGSDLSSEWIGKDREQFCINEAGQLQLNISPTEAGKASIGRKISYSSDMQWEVDIQMQHAPSDDNKLCIYLYQEDSNHYYYVRLGYAGKKKLGLRRHGNVDLIERQENAFQETPLLLHLKVTLEDNEKWTLYSRTEEMNGYKVEGTAIYPIEHPQEEGNFIFAINYTKSRSALFRIDNLSISNQITETPLESEEEEEPETPDISTNELPQLIEIEPLSTSSLRFTFDQSVVIQNATFSISDIGDAYRKNYVDEKTQAAVDVFFKKEMEAGKQYTISYFGVESKSGNLLPDYSVDLVLEEVEDEEETDSEETEEDTPTSYPEGIVLINEVMANPKGLTALPETEYVELFNTSDKAISLAGWQFVYGGSGKEIGKVTLPAKGYAVLYRSGREIEVDASGVAVPMEKFPSALANTGKELQLWSVSGEVIDQVTYAKATAGRSWERGTTDWYLSTDSRGGTPGSINSQMVEEEEPETEEPDKPETPEVPNEPDTPLVVDSVLPGEIVFNELLPNPYVGGSEYIELYNRSDRALPVSTLSLAVRKSDGTLSTRYPLSPLTQLLEGESYLLLTKEVEAVTAFYDIVTPSALCQVAKLPILANTASTLVLFRTADGVVIDEVSYSSKWHATFVKNEKGVALERIDPDAETQDEKNWSSALASTGGGTPGYQNSQYLNLSSDEPTGIETPVWIAETGNYRISYLLDQPGYYCRAFVFNTSGIRVAEISNHELLGTSGELIWNGMGQNGRSLSPGVYIFYAEVYHPESGKVQPYKKVFLVR